jgi:predicted regulator of Ras-like GTPase activity (Roadblock/LC7/MglB family)
MRTPAPADLQRWSDEVARDPRSLAFLPLARAYRKQSLSDAAMQLCLRGLESYPSHVEAHGLLAVLHAEQGDRQRAADEWSIVLRLDRDNFEALRGLGFCYLEEDRLSKARQMLERAALLRPTDPAVREALRLLGTRQELTERGVAGKPHAQDVGSSGTQPAQAADASPAGAEPWLETPSSGALTDPWHQAPASESGPDPWQDMPLQESTADPWHEAPPSESAEQRTQRAARQWEFAEPPEPGEPPQERVGAAESTVPETRDGAAAEDPVIELVDPVAEGQEPGAQWPEPAGAPKESIARQWEFAAEPPEPVRASDGAREERDFAKQEEINLAPRGAPTGLRTAAESVTDPGELFAELLGTGPVLAVLLVDARGLVLAGGITEGAEGDAAMLGAVLGGAAGEAVRTVAHLSLGEWRGVLLEADTALLHLTPVGDEAVIVLAARHSTPAGWMRRAAAQAVERAHPFLEAYR